MANVDTLILDYKNAVRDALSGKGNKFSGSIETRFHELGLSHEIMAEAGAQVKEEFRQVYRQ